MPKNADLFDAIAEGNILRIVELLVEKSDEGAEELNTYLNEADEDGETPLHAVYLANYSNELVRAIATVLIVFDANEEALNDGGLNPKHYREFRNPPKPLTAVERYPSEGDAESIVRKIQAARVAKGSDIPKRG